MALPTGFRLRLLASTGVLNAGATDCTTDGEAINTWQDQSGNALHAVQASATASHHPKYQVETLLHGYARPGVRFEHENATAEANRAWMTLDAGHNFDRRASTVFIVASGVHQVSATQCLIAPGTGGVYGTLYFIAATLGSSSLVARMNVASPVTTVPGRNFMGCQRAVYGYRLSSSNVRLYRNREYFDLGSALTAGETGGGFLGAFSASLWKIAATYYEVLHYPSALSDADIELAIAQLMSDHTIPTTIGNIVCDGDSIMAGQGVGSNAVFAAKNMGIPNAIALLQQDHEVYNIAVASQRISNLVTNFAGLALTRYKQETVRNFYCMNIGTNDTAAGVSAASLYASVVAHCGTARAAGFKVIINTQTPRNDGLSAVRDAYNALIRANWTQFADGLADLAVVPELADNTDLLYYDSDQLHFNSYGSQVAGQVFSNEINRINRTLPQQPRGRGR